MYNPKCDRCPLHLKACSVCVPGENTDTQHDLMLCGMNPGTQEDLRNQVFIGPAGEVLNECLAVAGIGRAAIALTNVVKCSSGKQKPTRTEISICTDLYLKEEIRRVKPRVIVALGDVALLALTGKGGINANRGQTLPLRPGLQPEGVPPITVVVTYHPAAYLHAGHDPRIKQAIQADLVVAREKLEGRQSQVLEVRYDPGAVYAAEVVGLDVETDKEGRLVVGTLATEDGAYLTFYHIDDIMSSLAKLKAKRILGWNLKYDLKVLAEAGLDIDRWLSVSGGASRGLVGAGSGLEQSGGGGTAAFKTTTDD